LKDQGYYPFGEQQTGRFMKLSRPPPKFHPIEYEYRQKRLPEGRSCGIDRHGQNQRGQKSAVAAVDKAKAALVLAQIEFDRARQLVPREVEEHAAHSPSQSSSYARTRLPNVTKV
jgi:hypothetical protein